MLKQIIILSFLLSPVFGEKLLTFQDQTFSTTDIVTCKTSNMISCDKVTVDVNALLNAKSLQLPNNLVITPSRAAKNGDTLEMTFENKGEHLQGVFVHGSHEGQTFVSGSVHWAKMKRHFRLDVCTIYGNQDDCYTWSEIDPKKWKNEASVLETHNFKDDVRLNQEQSRLLKQGTQDTTTPVKVTVTVFTTQSFRASFNNSSVALQAFVSLAVSETNQGYANSKVPISLSIHCIVNTNMNESTTSAIMLPGFLASSTTDFGTLRKQGDVGVILTAGSLDTCGVSYTNTLASGQTFGFVSKDCATGYYSFGHEIAHMVGALHNREVGKINYAYPSAYGFLIRPPVMSGLRTILAYDEAGNATRINYYSSPTFLYQGTFPTGNGTTDVAGLLIQRRFIMAAVGNESMTC